MADKSRRRDRGQSRFGACLPTRFSRLFEGLLPAGVEIDLMSKKCRETGEGILISHDWTTYPARIVAFESFVAPFSR